MADTNEITILCLASYFKGSAFMQSAKRQGCKVILVAKDSFKDEAWPRESLDEIYFMPDVTKRPDIVYAVSYLARSHDISQIIALDDYDVETAAALARPHAPAWHGREPGAPFPRQARHAHPGPRRSGVNVPEFTGVFNYDRLRDFMARVPAPWLLKPRSEASSMGIKKLNDAG